MNATELKQLQSDLRDMRPEEPTADDVRIFADNFNGKSAEQVVKFYRGITSHMTLLAFTKDADLMRCFADYAKYNDMTVHDLFCSMKRVLTEAREALVDATHGELMPAWAM